eukprot:TRINITY_DN4984_c0_g1_i1.p1 TRINITY_DN4984_c0_g1~~TRINITY_DN4984_c0_g1_i1.p1  ORF type:complete len:365 (+),score=75.44 TRINITY_DN4984_c0_g1_i1:66-1097(+)
MAGGFTVYVRREEGGDCVEVECAHDATCSAILADLTERGIVSAAGCQGEALDPMTLLSDAGVCSQSVLQLERDNATPLGHISRRLRLLRDAGTQLRQRRAMVLGGHCGAETLIDLWLTGTVPSPRQQGALQQQAGWRPGGRGRAPRYVDMIWKGDLHLELALADERCVCISADDDPRRGGYSVAARRPLTTGSISSPLRAVRPAQRVLRCTDVKVVVYDAWNRSCFELAKELITVDASDRPPGFGELGCVVISAEVGDSQAHAAQRAVSAAEGQALAHRHGADYAEVSMVTGWGAERALEIVIEQCLRCRGPDFEDHYSEPTWTAAQTTRQRPPTPAGICCLS